MGNQNSKEDFQFPDYLQIINDDHADKGYYELQDKRNSMLYIGRHLKSNGQDDELEKQSIIAEKIDNPSPFVTQLVEQTKNKEETYCSNQTIFHLLFRKVGKTLAQQIQIRKNSGKSFTPQQVDNTITRVTKGLKYIYNINHEHGHITSNAISWPTTSNENVMLIDQWALNKFEISPNKICPSHKNKQLEADEQQQKLSNDLYNVGNIGMDMLGGNYDPKFRKNIPYNINAMGFELLKQKLEILCCKDKQKRLQIYKLYEKMDLQPYNQSFRSSEQLVQNNQSQNLEKNNKIQNTLPQRPIIHNNIDNSYSHIQKTTNQVFFQSPVQGNFHKEKYNLNNKSTFFTSQQKSLTNQSQVSHPVNSNHSLDFHYKPIQYPQNQTQKINFTGKSDIRPIVNNMQNKNYQYQARPPVSFNAEPVFNKNQSSPQTAKFNTIKHSITNQSSAGIVKFMNSSLENQQVSQFSKNNKTYAQNSKVAESLAHTNNNQPFAARMVYSFPVGDTSTDSPSRELNNKIELQNKQITNIFQNLNLLKNPENSQAATPIKKDEFENKIGLEKQRYHMSTQIGESSDRPYNYASSSPQNYESTESNKNNLEKESQQKPEDINLRAYAIQPDKLSANISKKEENQEEQTPPRYGTNSNIVTTIPQLSESANSVTDEDRQYVVEEYQNGSKYEGLKSNGMRNGKGKFFYQEGSFYDGDWKNNNMHGFGKLYYSNNKIAYEGQWYMDQFHGNGKVYNDEPEPLEGMFDYTDFENLDQQWIYYQGTLISDSKEGYGVLVLSNKERYQGEFQNDNIHGKGKYFRLSGQVVHGYWKNSILEKKL